MTTEKFKQIALVAEKISEAEFEMQNCKYLKSVSGTQVYSITAPHGLDIHITQEEADALLDIVLARMEKTLKSLLEEFSAF